MSANPGVTCVELDGLTVISVKPYSNLVGAILGSVGFLAFGVWMFHRVHVSLTPILFLLGFMALFILIPIYTTIFTTDVLVVSADLLEKRWSCKPFHRRSQYPRAEIQSVGVNSMVVRSRNGTRTVWFVELTKTNGKKVKLINGGDRTRLTLASDYLNKALFPKNPTPA